jgi:hypothetical protein
MDGRGNEDGHKNKQQHFRTTHATPVYFAAPKSPTNSFLFQNQHQTSLGLPLNPMKWCGRTQSRCRTVPGAFLQGKRNRRRSHGQINSTTIAQNCNQPGSWLTMAQTVSSIEQHCNISIAQYINAGLWLFAACQYKRTHTCRASGAALQHTSMPRSLLAFAF